MLKREAVVLPWTTYLFWVLGVGLPAFGLYQNLDLG